MKPGTFLRAVGIGTVAVLLAAILMFLYAKSSSVDAEKKARVEGYLKQLKQLDAEWNVDILKSRMEINKNYDALTSPLAVLAATQVSLAEEAKMLGQAEPQKAVADLQLLDGVECRASEVKSSVLVMAQRRPCSSEKLQGQSPGD